jgi:hypothetical protein
MKSNTSCLGGGTVFFDLGAACLIFILRARLASFSGSTRARFLAFYLRSLRFK